MQFYFLVLFVLLPAVNAHSYVIGSKLRAHGKDYEVFVINGKGEKLVLNGDRSGDVDYEPEEIKVDEAVVRFFLADNPEIEMFTLTSGLTSANCNNSADIRTIVESKYFAVARTDKTVYKPGDKVAFKVFVFDEELRLYQPGASSLRIENGIGDVLKETSDEFRDADETSEGFFEVDESAVTGNYKIFVKIDNDEEYMLAGAFKVSNVIPKCFELLVEAESAVLISDNEISVNISAQYSPGYHVSGKVRVLATVYEESLEGKHWQADSKESDVQTSKTFLFNFAKDLGITATEISQIFVEFIVEFEESKTTQKVKSVHRTRICRELCRNVDILLTGEDMKPGFPFSFKVKTDLSFHEDIIVLVKLLLENVETGLVQEVERKLQQLAVNGTATFSLQIPPGTIEATIIPLMNQKNFKSVSSLPSKSRTYLRAEMANKSPKIGDQIVINVETTAEISTLKLLVFTFGKVVHTHSVDIFFDNSSSISFEATKEMSPSADAMFYSILESGEMISDSLEVRFEKAAMQELHLTASHDRIQSGEDCTITLKASPGSTVYLIGYLGTLTSDGLKAKFMTSNSLSYKNMGNDDHEANLFTLENDQHLNEKCLHHKNIQAENWNGGDFVSEEITESWFFRTVKCDEDGIVEVTESAPEKFGTWKIAASVFHPEHGAMISEIIDIKVTANISIQVIMPTSTRYRERTKIDVLIFNFMSEKEKVQVSLSKGDNYEDFEFLDCEWQSNDGFMKNHELEVAANSVESVSFYIRPLKPKNVEINLRADPENAEAIEMEQTLFVDREGFTKYESTSQLIDLRDSTKISSNLPFSVQENAILKSIKIEVSIETNLIKTALIKATKLIQPPTGSSEQKLIKYIQSMTSLKYLFDVDQLSDVTIDDLKKHLSNGYQFILNRRNLDGSFQKQGLGPIGSIWLTASVVNCLNQLSGNPSFFEVDEKLIREGLNFLKRQQKFGVFDGVDVTGSFVEFGARDEADVILTALVAIAFLENKAFRSEYSDVIRSAVSFVDSNVLLMKNTRDIAISAYALTLANQTNDARTMIVYLKNQAVTEHGMIHWNFNSTSSGSIDEQIEIASYALLSFLHCGEEKLTLQIMLWIVSQLNSNNRNVVKQESLVVGRALAEFTKKYPASKNAIDLTLELGSEIKKFYLESDHFMFEIPSKVRNVNIAANGTGFASVNIYIKYDIELEDLKDSFVVDVKVNQQEREDSLHLTICTSAKPDENDDQGSETRLNGVLEIELPDGYVYDSDSTDLLLKKDVVKIELQQRKSVVILDIVQITTQPRCIQVKGIQVTKTESSKASRVKLFDLNGDALTVEYYSLDKLKLC